MINVLCVWLVLFVILVGWGLAIVSLVRRVGGVGFGGAVSAFQTMWLGYAGLVCFLQLASLALPIATTVIVLSLVPAIVGYALRWRDVVRRTRRLRDRPRIAAVLACLVIVASVIIAYRACDAVRHYDSGLYHIQAVKWMTRYPVVPGLANLHVRFGYNNSFHLFAAYTDAWWEAVAPHLATGFLMVAVVAQWLIEIVGGRTPRGRLRSVFCLLTLPYLLARLWTDDWPLGLPATAISGLGTDLPLTIFAFVLLLELISLPPPSSPRRLTTTLLVLALGVECATTKLGGAALLGVAGLVALVALRGASWRGRLVAIGLPALVVIGWLVRGVIVSGWLIYPAFGRLPISWAVPANVAASDLHDIHTWSQAWGAQPGPDIGDGFWHWFIPWFQHFRATHEFVLLVVACALLAWRAVRGPTRARTVHWAGEFLALAACLLAIAQWFVAAPHPRYGSYLLWLLPATVLAPMIADAMRDARARMTVFILWLAFAVWSDAFAVVIERKPKLFGRPPAPPRAHVEPHSIGPGTTATYPVTGDQCWDAELPCTPGAHATQRDPSSLAAGYLPAN